MRLGECERLILPRRQVTIVVDGVPIRVKLARRPDGSQTAKAEMDDLAPAPPGQRQSLRRVAEERALQNTDDRDD